MQSVCKQLAARSFSPNRIVFFPVGETYEIIPAKASEGWVKPLFVMPFKFFIPGFGEVASPPAIHCYKFVCHYMRQSKELAIII